VHCELFWKKNTKYRKPFGDGEFEKECLECTADIICSAKKQAVSNISLSEGTIWR
jgi:hypothetical protein